MVRIQRCAVETLVAAEAGFDQLADFGAATNLVRAQTDAGHRAVETPEHAAAGGGLPADPGRETGGLVLQIDVGRGQAVTARLVFDETVAEGVAQSDAGIPRAPAMPQVVVDVGDDRRLVGGAERLRVDLGRAADRIGGGELVADLRLAAVVVLGNAAP